MIPFCVYWIGKNTAKVSYFHGAQNINFSLRVCNITTALTKKSVQQKTIPDAIATQPVCWWIISAMVHSLAADVLAFLATLLHFWCTFACCVHDKADNTCPSGRGKRSVLTKREGLTGSKTKYMGARPWRFGPSLAMSVQNRPRAGIPSWLVYNKLNPGTEKTPYAYSSRAQLLLSAQVAFTLVSRFKKANKHTVLRLSYKFSLGNISSQNYLRGAMILGCYCSNR